MRLFQLPLRQAILLLPLIISFSFKVSALEYDKRGGIPSCCTGSCEDDEIAENINPESDGPTVDGPTVDLSAGIGIEFETADIRFKSGTSTEANTDSLKGKLVGGRQGTNWKLTADTTLDAAEEVVAEYILDGTQIKIGTGAAAAAAAAVAADLKSWNPSKAMADNAVTIDSSLVSDWTISEPETSVDLETIGWAPQVTAPLPLEAIADLFSKAVASQASDLLPGKNPKMISVTKDFFQSSPNGISSDTVKTEVLGFFSLVLSYAKAAPPNAIDNVSPKTWFSIMPRTDFTTIFNLIKSNVPGDLYTLVKILACYKNGAAGVEIDTNYATGTVEAPVPNGKMDQQQFAITINDQTASCTVQAWIQSIAAGTFPDGLTKLDQIVDASIGGLGTTVENVLNTQRAVPLFEFRNLKKVAVSGMQDLATRTEQAIINYHNTYANAARLIRKTSNSRHSHIKRLACPLPLSNNSNPILTTSSTPSESPSPTPPPSSAPPPISYACSNYADPHQGSDFCTCDNGATALVASATGANTGSNYVPCPYTTAPPLATPTTITPPGGNQLYPFVTTMKDGSGGTIVEECQGSSTAYYGGYTEIMCAGNVVTLTAPPSQPSVSVTVGLNQILVGTLTSTELYTSISNVLEKLCPSVTSGTPVTVPAGTQTVPSIMYIGSTDLPPAHDGELLVTIDTGVYSDAGIRSAMIKALAQSFSTIANNNCINATWTNAVHGQQPYEETITVCNTANFAGVHYYPAVPFGGDQEQGLQWIESHMDFGVASGFDCAGFIDMLDAVLELLAPEFALQESEAGDFIAAICDAATQ